MHDVPGNAPQSCCSKTTASTLQHELTRNSSSQRGLADSNTETGKHTELRVVTDKSFGDAKEQVILQKWPDLQILHFCSITCWHNWHCLKVAEKFQPHAESCQVAREERSCSCEECLWNYPRRQGCKVLAKPLLVTGTWHQESHSHRAKLCIPLYWTGSQAIHQVYLNQISNLHLKC